VGCFLHHHGIVAKIATTRGPLAYISFGAGPARWSFDSPKRSIMKPNRIVFIPETRNGFYSTLKKTAAPIIESQGRYARWTVYAKALLFLALMVICALSLSTGYIHPMLAYALIGVCMHVLTLHVVHDAVHGALSPKLWVNRLATRILDVMGADGPTWARRHIHGHHPFPNILGWDVDVAQSNVVKIFPIMEKKRIHRFQHLYMPIVYLFYTLYWFFIRDWQNLFALKGAPVFTAKPKVAKVVLFGLVKLVALTWALVLPIALHPTEWGLFLTGFLLMHAVASLLGAFVLLSSHVDGSSDFTQPDALGRMPFTWAEHQVMSNCDYSTRSRFWTIAFGGFNHHIAHHLFPFVSKSKLPALTPLIVDGCKEFGIEYRERAFGKGLLGHFRFLREAAPKPTH
jgi:linoleoyl-CoA desaturase